MVLPAFVSMNVVVEDIKDKPAGIQLTWTDRGGQVQFAPIVTLTLRK
jgi:hypothetical protein